MIPERGKTRYFRKTITDLGYHDKVSSRGRYPQFLWWCIGSLTCWTTAQKPITFKHDAKRILTFSLDGLQSVDMAFGKGVVVCCYGRCRKKNNKTLRMSEGKCRISPTKAPCSKPSKWQSIYGICLVLAARRVIPKTVDRVKWNSIFPFLTILPIS